MTFSCARLAMLCVAVAAIGCGEDALEPRGNAQPGASCTQTNACAIGFICVSGKCAQTDPYRITLAWDVATDFDLHVQTPDGTHVYFDHPTAPQAWLGTDGCSKHACASNDDPNNTTHYEHAFLTDVTSTSDAGDHGTYQYWAENYDCDEGGAFTLTVHALDETIEQMTTEGTLTAGCTASERFAFPPAP